MSSLSNQLKRKRDAEARYRRNEAPPVYIDGGSGPTPEPEIEQGLISLNGLKGSVSITAGSNITVTPGVGTIEIESTASGGAATFTDLTDAPAAYSGEGGKVVAVKSTEDGLEFVPGGTGGLPDFMEMDTQAGLLVYDDNSKTREIARIGKVNKEGDVYGVAKYGYHENDTSVWYRTVSSSTISAVFNSGTSSATLLNASQKTSLNTVQTTVGRSSYEHPQVYWFRFPAGVSLDIVKFTILYSCANNRWGDFSELVIEASNDSSNGADGTWYTGAYIGIPSYGDSEEEATRDVIFGIHNITWVRVGAKGVAYKASPLIYSIFLYAAGAALPYYYGFDGNNMVPVGGLEGQALVKSSSTNFDTGWASVLPLLSGPALPTATSAFRGQIFTVEGGAGVADAAYVCLKDATDAYAWVQIS